jgi:RNA 2',3'-cyclic 3'-phosphodiesterase
MMRAFLAIDLPASLQSGLAEVVDCLKKAGADVRWVPVGNIHLTLKFFGNIKESEVEAIMGAACLVTPQIPPFDLQVTQIGAFPNIKSPRVIWLGMDGQIDNLSSLYRGLEQALATIGYLAEDRPLHPHLTLGRVRSSRGRDRLTQLLRGLALPAFPVFQVSELILFRSTLTPQGSIYTPLKKISLGKN